MVDPRYELAPAGGETLAREAIELAESAGLLLDDWQQHSLRLALRTTGRGKSRRWSAFEVGLNVSRQNGKGGILEARELLGLFGSTNERLTIHSSHQFDTSLEAFRRLLELIENTPELDQQVHRVARSHGEEGIELKNGRRVRFRTRTKGGGRGFSCDCLILDEAMILAETSHGALLPTLSARPNPQVWYTGSAVDQLVHEHGVVFGRVRERGIRGDEGLVYLEWSAEAEIEDFASALDDREQWRRSNPALGIRISEEHVEAEHRSMDPRTFAVERLGIGDWPPTALIGTQLIDLERWAELVDVNSQLAGPVCLAFDVTPDRQRSTISAAGRRPDGRMHIETIDDRRGTGWVPTRLRELADKHEVACIACDPASPASSLVRPIEERGLEVIELSSREYAASCGLLFDLVEQDGLRHLGTEELNAALRSAATRPLGESWAWSRRRSGAYISPLVAATIALWQAAASTRESVYESRGLVTIDV